MFNSFHHVGPSEEDFYIYFTHGKTANCFYSVVASLLSKMNLHGC
jgi:hypothetical protein